MGGELKNRKKLTVTIDKLNYEALDELAAITRIPKSKLVDEALNDLFAKHQEVIVEHNKKSFLEGMGERSKINWLRKDEN